ncbi:MAG: bifunctional adenosylcobinamide kinase/adenosylcobinamide-phosphate guanylyltransferase [Desulfobacterales bacterium]|jgi:adenosylcobinamide kinase/adenosylcobinamide-phosphate guanylyltransferase
MGMETLKEIVLVIGGCRSGKSTYGLQTAQNQNGDKKIFVATCLPQDEEMALRVERHQKERGKHWTTIEEPLYLAEAISEHSPIADVMLIDCLTLWVSNLFMKSADQNNWEEIVSQLIDALKTASCPLVVVSNEVGTGIVPENKLARQFRDIIGLVNQAVAKIAGKVVWMVAGIPVVVKG